MYFCNVVNKEQDARSLEIVKLLIRLGTKVSSIDKEYFLTYRVA